MMKLALLVFSVVVFVQQDAGASTVSDSSISQVLELHGSGTTNPSKFIWKALSTMNARSKVPIRSTYRAVGSGTGIKEFVGKAPNYESSGEYHSGDIPVGAELYQNLTNAGIEMFHIPFVLGSISFFHSVPVPNLDLNACLLARIFSAKITTWDHEDILAFSNNNDHKDTLAGQAITVVHRVLGSSSTSIATAYLKVATEDEGCPEAWPAELVGKLVDWPEGTVGKQGSSGVSDFVGATPFSVTYLDSGHGITEGLSEVAIQNKAGKILTSQQAVKGDAAELSTSIPADLSADWSSASLLNVEGDDTWPMMTWSYIFIRKDLSDKGEAGGLAKALVEYILTEGQDKEHVSQFGFEAVPESLRLKGLAALDELILADGVTSWEFETSTAPFLGHEDHIFSSKRDTYELYLLDGIVDPLSKTLSELADKIATVETTTSDLKDTVAASSSTTVIPDHEHDNHDDDHDVLATAALAVAIVALVISIVGNIVLYNQLQFTIKRLSTMEKTKSYEEDTSSQSNFNVESQA
jgi:ABC-type phosphate transport system substrate-binding protein